jgi:hypothetical protein
MANSSTNPEREIDVLEFFSLLWRGIVNIFRFLAEAFLFVFLFGIRRIHWLIIFAALGAGIGFLVYKATPRYYSSEMIAQPNGFTSYDMAQYINDIHDMCEKDNFEGISEAFKIPIESAELIRDIEAFFFVDVNGDGIGDHIDYENKYDPEDTTKSIIMNRILIRAEVMENSVFQEVKEGLVHYVDNNEYLITVNKIRKKELEALIAQHEQEINKLDSLQDFEYYKDLEEGRLDREGQIVFMNEKLTQLYYRDKSSLLDKSLEYQKALELATDPLTIIKNFAALQVEENPLSRYIGFGGFFMGLLGYFYLLYYAYRRSILDYLSEKAK